MPALWFASHALRLRGTLSFETRADYEAFVGTVVQRMNSRVAKLLPSLAGYDELFGVAA